MITKKIAILLALILFIESLLPVQLYGLTSGPIQPEFSSFEPIGTSEMVDLFTGDFKYNIPLLNVPGENGGYPINLFYNSVTSMEEEASMVGLGWNIGLGSINRSLNGIPDDFDGEMIRRRTSMKDRTEVSISGGASAEVFPVDAVKTGVGYSVSLMYNNYNGLGFSAGVNTEVANFVQASTEFNSFTGFNYSTGIKLPYKYGVTTGISGNTLDGIKSLNFGFSYKKGGYTRGSNSSWTDFPTFYMNYDHEYKGFTVRSGVKPNVPVAGFSPYSRLARSYSVSKMVNKDKWVSIPSYGMIYAEQGQNKRNVLQDFSRYKDRNIRNGMLNLPLSKYTPDQFNISGHGTGGSFTYMRNDIGTSRDKESSSTTVNLVGEIGAGTTGASIKVDAKIAIGLDKTNNTAFDIGNSSYKFQTEEPNMYFQKGYFKKSDEFSGRYLSESNSAPLKRKRLQRNYDYQGEDEIVRQKLKKGKFTVAGNIEDKLVLDKDNSVVLNEIESDKYNIRARNNVIQAYHTSQYLDDNNNVLLPFLDVRVFDVLNEGSSDPQPDVIDSDLSNQVSINLANNDRISAFVENQDNGSRYVYGLPVMNLRSRDYQFSVECDQSVCDLGQRWIDIPNLPTSDVHKAEGEEIHHTPDIPGSNDMLDIKEIPEYASSYLITSILGKDYVDFDSNDGLPNNKDEGHWVKFDYVRVNNANHPYRWRAPFVKSMFNPGHHALETDDIASFSYGEREQYLPYSIETNTHIAYFTYSKRNDGRGANFILENDASDNLGAFSYKLDKIELYIKGDNTIGTANKQIVKTVDFTYASQGLCPGILNSETPLEGKLTLSKVSISNYSSTRGQTTPYEFTYFDQQASYDVNLSDRWGTYKPLVNGNEDSQNYFHPYSLQTEDVNDYIEAFHLKSIKLPSGSVISVDIERDHYGYVQDNKATKMVKILGLGSEGENTISTNGNNSSFDILFQREPKIGGGYEDVNGYIEGLYHDESISTGKQLLFKIYSRMTKSEDSYDYVIGAADIESVENVGNSGLGKIRVKAISSDKIKIKNVGTFNYHPFVVANWQYLKLNLRKLLTPGMTLKENNDGSEGNASSIVSSLKALGNTAWQLTKGFYRRCNGENYGKTIDLDKSYIRLVDPKSKKYGDGVRVTKIAISDVWNKEDTPEYGKVYLYEDEEGRSTGVASNEPFIGKEENNFYYIKSFVEDMKFGSDNMKFELSPFNDLNLPGPKVGYQKVIERSLASHENGNSSSSTTGQTVHEFYTAKDFPFISKESLVRESKYAPRFVPVPVVGTIENSIVRSSQGYLSEGNDMHGKPKKVTYFGQSKDGSFLETPVSSVEYFYKSKRVTYDRGSEKREANVLVNEVSLMETPYPYEITGFVDPWFSAEGELGVSRSVCTDLRSAERIIQEAGGHFNIDFTLPFIITPSGVPEVYYNQNSSRTGVVSKHISRKGILDKVIATDGKSIVETENMVFCPYTGSPLVSRVTNEHDEEIVNSSIPAHLIYSRMGEVFHQLGHQIELDFLCMDEEEMSSMPIISKDDCTDYYAISKGNTDIEELESLISGDELILDVSNTTNNHRVRAVFVSKIDFCDEIKYLFDIEEKMLGNIFMDICNGLDEEESELGKVEMMIYRSGNRNQLNEVAQSVVQNVEDKLLNHEIQEYCDIWKFQDQKDNITCNNQQPRQLPRSSSQTSTVELDNDYTNGAKGIFRPNASWSVLRNRISLLEDGQSNSVVEFEAKKTGRYTYPDMIPGNGGDFANFTWESWNFRSAEGEWIRTNYVSKVTNTGQPIEVIDALGNASASLYCSNTKESGSNPQDLQLSNNALIAKSRNALHCEIAYSSFEEYECKNTFTNSNYSGHFELPLRDITVTEKSFAHIPSFGSGIFYIDRPYNSNNVFLNESVEIIPQHINSANDQNSTVQSIDLIEGRVLTMLRKRDNCTEIAINNFNVCKEDFDYNLGDNFNVIFKRSHELDQSEQPMPSGFSFDQNYSHTGDRSLKVENTGTIKNLSLELYRDKDYWFSCWVFMEDFMSKNVDAEVKILSDDESQVLGTFSPEGPRINGWQLVRGKFTMGTTKHFKTSFDPMGGTVYVDDVRIQPYESSMECYVYDSDFMRISESLDENNFYTRYIYDGEGKLVSIQKETENGVKSLQEKRSYIKDRVNN